MKFINLQLLMKQSVPLSSKFGENYEMISYYENDQIFKFDTDTLVEISSKHSRLKEKLKFLNRTSFEIVRYFI